VSVLLTVRWVAAVDLGAPSRSDLGCQPLLD
jgi:hypothetical protein